MRSVQVWELWFQRLLMAGLLAWWSTPETNGTGITPEILMTLMRCGTP
jgi:preprotein translocase subunit Sec61beta